MSWQLAMGYQLESCHPASASRALVIALFFDPSIRSILLTDGYLVSESHFRDSMLNDQDNRELVASPGAAVNVGRSIRQIIDDGEIQRLHDCTVLEGKISDSVFGSQPVTRGAIPFKEHVLAMNHDYMLNLLRDVLSSSQFEVADIKPTSTVIPSESWKLITLQNVLRGGHDAA